MIGITGLLIAGLAAGAGAAAPLPGPDPDVDTIQAVELEREAAALYARPDQWHRAAQLLERAAEHRATSDPRRTENLVVAARIHGHLRNTARAERLFGMAAEEAHARGALLDAARAYLDAADIALLRGDRSRASSLIAKAELLSGSPHLSSAEQHAIRARLPETRRG